MARAYKCSVSWGKALAHHYVANNRDDYLKQLARRKTITADLIEEMVTAVDSHGPVVSKSNEWMERVSNVVSMLTDVEVKYRIASRLGLRPLVNDLLSSSALPYLKDTAWKTANQHS